jgi:periplasmic divalent cation tolerance protein
VNTSDLVFVYTTLPDEQSARQMAETLVRNRLAVCVNIHGPMTSVYEWQGALETGPEYAAFIKTGRKLAEAVIAAARAIHPYTVPCFLVLPIEAGNEDYLAWAHGQLQTDRARSF